MNEIDDDEYYPTYATTQIKQDENENECMIMFSNNTETVNAYPPFFQHQNQMNFNENIPTQILDHQRYIFQLNNMNQNQTFQMNQIIINDGHYHYYTHLSNTNLVRKPSERNYQMNSNPIITKSKEINKEMNEEINTEIQIQNEKENENKNKRNEESNETSGDVIWALNEIYEMEEVEQLNEELDYQEMKEIVEEFQNNLLQQSNQLNQMNQIQQMNQMNQNDYLTTQMLL